MSALALYDPQQFRLSITDSADDNTKRLYRAQYDQYKAQYVPVENQLLSGLKMPTNGIVQRAVGRARAGFDSANRATARLRSRYGMRGLADVSRLDKLAKAAMVSQAGYDTAKQARDINLDRLGKIVALGKGLSSQSGDTLLQAAQNEQNRKMAQAQMDAQAEQARNQMLGNLAMTALFLIPKI